MSIRFSATPRNGGAQFPRNHAGAGDQPFYHLLAENDETEYVAYVSEQNLLVDVTGTPVRHPQVNEYFKGFDAKKNSYMLRERRAH